MRKMLTLVLVMIVLALQAHIEPPKTHKEKQKALQVYSKKAAAGMKSCRISTVLPDQSVQPLVDYWFDDKGRESHMTLFDEGKETARVVQVYDAAGNLILDADRDPQGLLMEMNVLEYDEDGLIYKIVSYDSTWHISGCLTYESRPETNEIYVTKHSPDQKLEYTISYLYQENPDESECVEIIQNEASGAQRMRVENEYGADGLRSSKLIFGSDNSLSYRFDYTYTPSGDFKEITQLSPEGEVMRKDYYTYNEMGFVERFKSVKANGQISIERVYTYQFE